MKKTLLIFFLLGSIIGVVAYKAIEYLNFEIPTPVATLPDGAIYDGDMVDGIIEGKGRMLWPNGHRYEGPFKNGLFHGHGRYETPYVWSYEGEFSAGNITGTGTMIYSEDQQYTGELKYGRAQGKGIQHAWGNVYEGEFKDDKFNGIGMLTNKNGDVYTGEFEDNLFHGQGTYITSDNRIYTGEFVKGAFTGQGSYTNNAGETYEGSFENWAYHGKGNFKDEKGDRYTGTFVQGRLTGKGEHIASNGAHYTGEFKHGQYHGKGTLTYARPLDGISVIHGTWKNGKLIDAEEKSLVIKPEINNEITLYNQNELLAASWQQLRENDPDNIDLYFLGIAGDGTQGVFRREALFVKDYFDRVFGTAGKSMTLINSTQTIKEIPLATTTSIKHTLEEIVKRMDRENDILFIYMTSHGSDDFEFVIKQAGMDLPYLPAKTLAEALKDIPIKWKVIVISACFSGGFIPELKDDHTLIITAAAADRQSFGCEDRNEFTYFGEAYFKDALFESENFVEAFNRAVEIVTEREKAGNYEHSYPRIHKPAPILQHLEQWRSGLSNQVLSE